VLWLRDGDFAYYNSKLLIKAPGLGDRDPLREALDETQKHDVPIISYCVVQQGGIYLRKNPQWQMRDSEGKPIGRFCFNSGYLEAMVTVHGLEGQGIAFWRVSPPPTPPHNVADLSESVMASSFAATLWGGGHAPPRERLRGHETNRR
jgi:hypothetical protein